ncbi:MAG: hypothetical protein KC684_00235 [Candidatus Omnitrophica bacterium]|nr:hypothetical protein [Candidatus Omnitrophota bacterium]
MMIFSGRTARDPKAFTFLEVLITTILLTIGVVAILQMFSIGLFAGNEVENSTTAMYLAQAKMEEVRDASSYAGIDSFASARANVGGSFSGFDREVVVSGNPKQVNVVVYWNVKGTDQSIDLVSLFADYDYE